jgi:hypothetical protein
MDSSSVLTFSANGERLMCGGFSLGETVCLRSFDFIADYFDGLSLSPKRGDSGTAFMGSTHSGPPSSRWAMIEDSNEEFHMASGGGGGSGSPLIRGSAWGLCLHLSQPHRGRRMLRPSSLC